jgi:hypothetical protein
MGVMFNDIKLSGQKERHCNQIVSRHGGEIAAEIAAAPPPTNSTAAKAANTLNQRNRRRHV